MTDTNNNSTPLNDEQLDTLLDAWKTPNMALGLPSRIVAAAQSQKRRQRLWLRRTVASLSVAAAAVVFVVLILPGNSTPQPNTAAGITNVRGHGPTVTPAVPSLPASTIQVEGLSEADFQRVMDTCSPEECKALLNLPPAERIKAFRAKLDELHAK